MSFYGYSFLFRVFSFHFLTERIDKGEGEVSVVHTHRLARGVGNFRHYGLELVSTL